MSNVNEPAFPTSVQRGQSGEYWTEQEGGLTKREYMATKLAAAIMAGSVARGCPRNEWPDAMRDGAWLADTLLAELAK